MSRWKFIVAIYRPWKVIVGGLITILGCYDLFLSQFVEDAARDKYPKIADVLGFLGWPWYVWVIIILGMIIIFLIEGAYRYVGQLGERPELQQLSEILSRGVALRNDGFVLFSDASVEAWISRYNDWENDMLTTLVKISPGKTSFVRTLNRWTPTANYPKAFNAKHHKYLQIFDEKLRRLQNTLKELTNNKHEERT